MKGEEGKAPPVGLTATVAGTVNAATCKSEECRSQLIDLGVGELADFGPLGSLGRDQFAKLRCVSVGVPLTEPVFIVALRIVVNILLRMFLGAPRPCHELAS